MNDQNWRTETNAGDYFAHQKKQVQLENRRPVIRRASDLVGPGIAATAVRLTDFNDLLGTYDGFFSAASGALNAPNGEGLVGTVVGDSELGGVQTFTGLTTAVTYQRIFTRNPGDAETIYWGTWETIGGGSGGGGVTFLETLPVSIIDAKGDLIVGTADNVATRKAVGPNGYALVGDDSSTGGIKWDTRVASVVPDVDSPLTVDNTDPMNPVIGLTGVTTYLFCNTDTAVCTVAGTFTLVLSHIPIDGSLLVMWNGVPQLTTDWSLSYQTITFNDSHIKVGDTLSTLYTYAYEVATAPSITSPVAGDVLNDVTPTISGTSDAEGGTVTVTVDGSTAGTATVTGGVWSLETAVLAVGSHTASASDINGASGNVTFSITKNFATYVASISPTWWDRLGEPNGASGSVDSSGNGHGGGTFASVSFNAPGLVGGDPDTAANWTNPGRLDLGYGAWMDSASISGAILYKTTNTDLNGICFMSRWNASSGQLWSFDHVNGIIRLRLNGTTVSSAALGVNDGNKHQAGFTYDGTTVNLLSDGAVVKTQTVSATIIGSTGFTLGADYGGGSGTLLHHFQGVLDEARYKAGLWTPQNFKTMWELAQ